MLLLKRREKPTVKLHPRLVRLTTMFDAASARHDQEEMRRIDREMRSLEKKLGTRCAHGVDIRSMYPCKECQDG